MDLEIFWNLFTSNVFLKEFNIEFNKGDEIKDTDNHLEIKAIYKATRQLSLVIKLYLLRHEAILFETTDGKNGIFEWMDVSKIHSYFLEKTEINSKKKRIEW